MERDALRKENSKSNFVECPICNEERTSLKFLNCEHTFCLICIESMSRAQGTKTSIKCPIDRTVSSFPNGGINSLKTKFFAKLPCESCDEEKVIKDCWWCLDCEVTVCSECAMKKHRTHSCNQWENYDVVNDCIDFYKSKCPQSVEQSRKCKDAIKEFCKTLEDLLLRTVLEEEKSFNAIEQIKKTFGQNFIEKLPKEKKDVTKIEKKLKTVSNVISSIEQGTTLPADFNEGFCHPVVLPMVEQVLSLCVSTTMENIVVNATAKENINVASTLQSEMREKIASTVPAVTSAAVGASNTAFNLELLNSMQARSVYYEPYQASQQLPYYLPFISQPFNTSMIPPYQSSQLYNTSMLPNQYNVQTGLKSGNVNSPLISKPYKTDMLPRQYSSESASKSCQLASSASPNLAAAPMSTLRSEVNHATSNAPNVMHQLSTNVTKPHEESSLNKIQHNLQQSSTKSVAVEQSEIQPPTSSTAPKTRSENTNLTRPIASMITTLTPDSTNGLSVSLKSSHGNLQISTKSVDFAQPENAPVCSTVSKTGSDRTNSTLPSPDSIKQVASETTKETPVSLKSSRLSDSKPSAATIPAQNCVDSNLGLADGSGCTGQNVHESLAKTIALESTEGTPVPLKSCPVSEGSSSAATKTAQNSVISNLGASDGSRCTAQSVSGAVPKTVTSDGAKPTDNTARKNPVNMQKISLAPCCTDPVATCFMNESTLVFLNGNGLHIVDINSESVVRSVQWKIKKCHVDHRYPPHMVYCESSDKIFVTRGDASMPSVGLLHKYDKNLNELAAVNLPGQQKTLYKFPRLLCIVNDNKILLATSDGNDAIIWTLGTNGAKWKKVWNNEKLEPFFFIQSSRESNRSDLQILPDRKFCSSCSSKI